MTDLTTQRTLQIREESVIGGELTVAGDAEHPLYLVRHRHQELDGALRVGGHRDGSQADHQPHQGLGELGVSER